MTVHRSDRPLLEIQDLRTHFFTQDGTVKAVDGVSYEIGDGKTVGVVGESGCGKSITALSVMRLIEQPGRIVGGSVLLRGRDLLRVDDAEMRDIRGNQISMIFQEPMTSLNPVYTCGDQISEAVSLHEAVGRRQAWERAVEMLQLVGIPDPARRAKQYPHELSGGMRQRVMIAMALSTNPELLIADEPTTALDVTVQAQVLKLLREIRDTHGTAILLITHDLGVIAGVCDWVYVMYAGAVLEQGPVRRIFERPAHPYTQALLRATPTVRSVQGELLSIPGQIPPPYELPLGCRFADRCPRRFDRCASEPAHLEVEPGHTARCWLLAAPERAGRDA